MVGKGIGPNLMDQNWKANSGFIGYIFQESTYRQKLFPQGDRKAFASFGLSITKNCHLKLFAIGYSLFATSEILFPYLFTISIKV